MKLLDVASSGNCPVRPSLISLEPKCVVRRRREIVVRGIGSIVAPLLLFEMRYFVENLIRRQEYGAYKKKASRTALNCATLYSDSSGWGMLTFLAASYRGRAGGFKRGDAAKIGETPDKWGPKWGPTASQASGRAGHAGP